MKLKDITIEFVKRYSGGGAIYQRGERYYEDGAVLEMDVGEKQISAVVAGTDDYNVEIIEEGGDISSSCDCPYDGFVCKHVVAVMLEFANNKQKYFKKKKAASQERAGIKEHLGNLSQEELIKLVLECADKYKDFRRDLLLRFESSSETTLKVILKEIERAFPRVESRTYSTRAVSRTLREIMKSIDSAPKQIKVEAIWEIAKRTLQELNEYGIDDVGLEDVVIDCLKKIQSIHEKEDLSTEKRRKIISGLVDFYLWGNCGIVDWEFDTAMELCKGKDDYQLIIDKLSKKKDDDYHSETIAELHRMMGDEEAFLREIMENLRYGMDYYKLVEYWKEKGNRQKAVEIAEGGIKKGEGRIIDLVEFLKKYYKGKKDYENQLHMLRLQIKEEMSFDLYKEAKSFCKPEDWKQIKKEILDSSVCGPFSNRTLGEIYKYEQQYDKLFSLVKKDEWLLPEFEEDLISLYPMELLSLYRKKVEQRISLRNHSDYASAAHYAEKIKRIYRQILKNTEEWDKYIRDIRTRYQKLPALIDEFKKL
ncbi:MAG TPA: SWIM zinc finger family protein [Thermodesulfobacteriota bacterium]|nr:SWIM zinc finger family protein [Thermodesulfobacteriota bacterium]